MVPSLCIEDFGVREYSSSTQNRGYLSLEMIFQVP